MLLFAASALGAPVVDPFTEPDEADLYTLDEQIVTVAARYAQAVQDAPAIVTVLTDRQLRDRGFRTLADALRSLPGVYVTSTKESRKLAWFRGVISADDSKFLLLIDGVPWYDGVYTHAWIDEYLPLEAVRQIEIIKGPGSTIYGTNAFSGVINIVTYTPKELSGGFVRVLGGTAARRGVSAVAGHPFTVGDLEGGVTAYARYYEADGDGLDVSPRGNANVSGDDPKRAINGGLELWLEGLSVRWDGFDYRHTYYTLDQDDALDVLMQSPDDFWLAYHDQLATVDYRIPVGRRLTITPRVSWRQHDDPGQYAFFGDPVTTAEEVDGSLVYSTSWDTTLVETVKETQAVTGTVDVEWRPSPAHVVVAGAGAEATFVERIADVYYEDLSHTGIEGRYYADPSVLWGSWVYAQDTWTALPFLEITAGARLDYHGTYGAFPSPRAGVLLLPTDAIVLKLLYGRAFRAPTAREWLVEVSTDEEGRNDFTKGNPALVPESINTVEAELAVTPSRALKLRAAGFYSSVTNEINKVTPATPDPILGDDYYDNSGGADIVGAEAQATLTLGAFDLDGSYSFTWATDRDSGRQQYEFPAHMAHARVGWRPVDLIRANLLLDVIGPRTRAAWSPDAGAEDAPAYALVGAGIATDALGGRVRVDLAAYNLLDTAYTTWLYRDDTNEMSGDEARYPVDPAGEGRQIQVGVEVVF